MSSIVKEQEEFACVICGRSDAGQRRNDGDGWYCTSPERDCWGTIFEEQSTLLCREKVSATCPFCNFTHEFDSGSCVEGICGCGAKFSEGYDELVRFKRKKGVV